MPSCLNCQTETFVLDGTTGLCIDCQRDIIGEEEPIDPSDIAGVMLTTEAAHGLDIDERIDIVTAECALGMHLFKDIAIAFRDTFGGRSKTMEVGLRDARKTVLAELRHEAYKIGAEAVVGVSLHYNEISGSGKSMLLVVASGTAVTLK